MINVLEMVAKGERIPAISAQAANAKTLNFWTFGHNGQNLLVSDTSLFDKERQSATSLYPGMRIWLVGSANPGYSTEKGGDLQLVLAPARKDLTGRLLHDPEALTTDKATVIGTLTHRPGVNGQPAFFEGTFEVTPGELIECRANISAKRLDDKTQTACYLAFRWDAAQNPTRSYRTPTNNTPPTNSADNGQGGQGGENTGDDIPF